MQPGQLLCVQCRKATREPEVCGRCGADPLCRACVDRHDIGEHRDRRGPRELRRPRVPKVYRSLAATDEMGPWPGGAPR